MHHLTPAEWVIKQFGGICEAARAIGVARSALIRWREPRPGSLEGRRTKANSEAGDIPVPQIRVILAAARARCLDVTERDLIYGRDVVEPEPAAV
jgi:hypothetical protein